MPAGKPKKFRSGKQLIGLFNDFCNDIRDNDYDRIPSQTSFCRWLCIHYDSVTRQTIYNYLNKYFYTVKKEFEQIQGDTIAEGGMLGKYNPTMSIFALKNWCAWSDKKEQSIDITESLADDELSKSLKEIANKL